MIFEIKTTEPKRDDIEYKEIEAFEDFELLLWRKEFGQCAHSHLVTWRIMIWPLCAFEREPRNLYDARL